MGNLCQIQILARAGPVAPTHENQYIYIRFIVAEKKESIVESKLNPLNHLHPLITGVASTAIFDPNSLFHSHQLNKHFPILPGLPAGRRPPFNKGGRGGFLLLRYALCDFVVNLPDRPAPIDKDGLTGDEIRSL